MSCGFHNACKKCPFSMLCLMGTFVNDINKGRSQIYLCPDCGGLAQEMQPFARVHCPSRKLTGSWKGGWTSKYRKACRESWEARRAISYEALTTSISVKDPMEEGRYLYVYLCEHCFQDPPSAKFEVSIYDCEAGPP